MQLYNSRDGREKSSPRFEIRLGTIKGRLMLFNIIQKKVRQANFFSTNFRDKLQFVNSMKRLIFDLTKIPLLKCLICTYCLTAEVVHDHNLLTESNLGD